MVSFAMADDNGMHDVDANDDNNINPDAIKIDDLLLARYAQCM